jgi:cytosine/adenosine deaminase-related metal-dependent hydrolase
MAYRKFQADQLFTGYKLLARNNVLITDEEGIVQDIVSQENAGGDIKFLEGILTPGFVNSHCHLELSHLKNIIPPHTGLIEFLCSVVTKREAPTGTEDPAKNKFEAIIAAEKEMYDSGIMAVGDIGNTADTAQVKSKSNIYWQNFVEVISFTDAKADENFQHYFGVAEEMKSALRTSSIQHRTSLVPHAPYSISPKTFDRINAATKNQIISIHNQEHTAEDDLYKTGGGEYLKLFKIFGIDKSPFPVTGLSSIRSYLPYFTNGQTIFLVHNTYMPEEDIVFAKNYAAENGLTLIYCFCINANLYIENKVPAIENFIKHNCHIVLGTDSYSSNWQLSIAKEISSMQKHFPQLGLDKCLQWATINGAKALHRDDQLGSFEKGKKPGVVVLNKNFDSKRIL